MITIIHGTNEVATRNQLQLIRNNFQEVIVLDGQNLDRSMFIQSLESDSLFGTKKLIIVEHFFAGKSKRDDILAYLLNNEVVQELVFWEKKESQSKDLLALAKSAKIIKLNISTVIFKFLDSIKPSNLTQSLLLYKQALSESEPEIIFFMIIKLFRNLILVSGDSIDGPADFKRLLPWQIAKLRLQAKLFSFERLSKIYKGLVNLDFRQKNGISGIILENNLSMFLINEL